MGIAVASPGRNARVRLLPRLRLVGSLFAAASGRAVVGACALPCRCTAPSALLVSGAAGGRGIGGKWPGLRPVRPWPRAPPCLTMVCRNVSSFPLSLLNVMSVFPVACLVAQKGFYRRDLPGSIL